MKVFRPTILPAAKPQIANPSGPAAQPMLAACCRWEGTDLILSVKVYPRSGKFSLVLCHAYKCAASGGHEAMGLVARRHPGVQGTDFLS